MKKCVISFAKIIITACLIIAFTMPVFSQQNDFSRLEEIANAELKETRTPGAAIAIISQGKIVFKRGFGIANVETNAAVTTDTLFRIGSMTKMFTALALLGLAEEGKLKLDAPIGNYIRELNPAIGKITFHQLLSHTSGIRDDARPFGLHDETVLLNSVRGWKEDYLFTEPGKIFSYSNLNYSLIGAALEEISGKSYADAMSERIFKPLGMSRATFRPTEAMTHPLAQGHAVRGSAPPTIVRPYTDNVQGWAAGFMFSNINDAARFAVAFTSEGMLEGKQTLLPKSINKAATPVINVPGTNVKYAYGLRIEEIRGVKIISHGGALPGFGSQIMFSTDHRFAVIVLANKSGARLEKTVEAALETMLPLQAKPEVKSTEPKEMNQKEMQGYTGVYKHSPRQFFEIVVQEGKLFLKDEEELISLVKIADNRFLYRRSGAVEPDDLTLIPGSDGNSEYLHINGRAFKKIVLPEKK